MGAREANSSHANALRMVREAFKFASRLKSARKNLVHIFRFLSPPTAGQTSRRGRSSNDGGGGDCDDGVHCDGGGNSTSRSFEFGRALISLAPPSAHTIASSAASSPARHLTLPSGGSDAEMRSSAATSDSEMASSASAASSAKEQRPALKHLATDEATSAYFARKMLVAPLAASATSVDAGETTPRLPFQLLQHQSGESDDAPLSATPPARLQPPVFFADEEEPPAKASKSSSSSNGAGSQKSVLVAPGAAAVAAAETTAIASGGLSRVSSIGVVRRRSWRTHYVRPNKSLDTAESPSAGEVSGAPLQSGKNAISALQLQALGVTSHSTPMCGPTRRGSTTTTTTVDAPAARSETAVGAESSGGGGVESVARSLIRRKSSGSSATPTAAVATAAAATTAAAKQKAPIGVRHSTHT